MTTYLITGGAGFMGSNFIRFLLNTYRDIKVINLDKLTYAGNLENLKDIENDPRYRFVKGDICDPQVVEPLVEESDVVVNFAAETHVDRSVMEAGSFVLTDVYGSYILLQAARKYGIDRFIQISTDEVYGSIKEGSFSESDSLHPSNPYSASKAGGENLVYSFYKTYSMPIIITRATNNFGPY
ncbi:MAG: GDP-mannose 4,6-dehydratase, partial [Candidatus Aminicenantes bacterium]|nr:GDP-mannose 4,6-dehydratase [Candidatus Aminicenantes bacterium]